MNLPDLATRLARSLSRVTSRSARTRGRSAARPATVRSAGPVPSPGSGPTPSATRTNTYLGDWREALPHEVTWRPTRDGRPDPGEVVWAWVPFEEDHSQGKDRPVLVVAISPRSTDVALALPLTSKDHDRDAAQEARAGRHWMDVGAGAWDRSGRPSEARLDRVLQLRISDVLREGAALEEKVFREVYAAAQRMTGA